MSYPKQSGSGTEHGYNGWKNYETWNVALWIQNDEELYKLAKLYKHSTKPYKTFTDFMLITFGDGTFVATPDKVRWDNNTLDFEALDSMIREL